MAQKFLTSIDLSKNELQNARIQNLATAPSSPVAGQIYFDTSENALKYYNGSLPWITVKDGDITSVVAGLGLTGGGDSGAVTLSAAVDGNTIQFATLGELYVGDNSITSQQLDATGVAAGAYGAPTQIPIITVSEDGRITDASFAPISSTLTISDTAVSDDIQIGTDTLTFSGTANEVTTAVTDNTVTIGLPNDVTIGNNLTVNGNLTVSGTTTTVDTETILLADNIITLNSNATGTPTENAGIDVNRGGEAPMSLFWDETNDDWYATDITGTPQKIINEASLPGASTANGYAATINGNASTASFNVDYPSSWAGLNPADVMVQIVDEVSYETVHVDVSRSATGAQIQFAQAPGVGENYRVLFTKIG